MSEPVRVEYEAWVAVSKTGGYKNECRHVRLYESELELRACTPKGYRPVRVRVTVEEVSDAD